MSTISTETTTELALAFQPAGYDEIPASTILTRLNYYDGKFLRADDLRLEQDYVRRLSELIARAGAAGLVYGFDVSLGSGDLLTIGGGLGFDAAGRVLYVPGSFSLGLQALVQATKQLLTLERAAFDHGSSGFAVCAPNTPQPPTPAAGAEFYLLTIAHAEAACGDEEVFGKLCDDGCATSTDRAYVLEGVVVRARPYLPTTPFATSKVVQLTEKHTRSQYVSAMFADERLVVPSLISKAGLLGGAWCTGAAAPTGWEVPIAVVGTLTTGSFVDEWVVRRERMETPPRRYWAWTMAMRPWDAYLAQILQFQCQLPSALGGQDGGTAVDPCAQQRDALGDAVRYIGQLQVAFEAPAPTPAPAPAPADAAPAAEIRSLSLEPTTFLSELGGIARLQGLQLKLTDVLKLAGQPSQRILVDGGIVELPPAGYLPVTPGTTPPVDTQVRRLLGDGLDLRFCVTTPDYVPHALEKAQHMERISLLQGLDDPTSKPPVDILVPNGQLGAAAVQATGWDTEVVFSTMLLGLATASVAKTHTVMTKDHVQLHGVGRSAPAGNGGELSCAGPGKIGVFSGGTLTRTRPVAAYAAARFDTDPFSLATGATFTATAEGAIAVDPGEVVAAGASPIGMRGTLSATLTVDQTATNDVTASGTLQANGGTADGTPGSASVAVTAEIKREAQAFSVTITDSANREVLLYAGWQGTPLTVEAAMGVQRTGAMARVDPSVADLTTVQTPIASPFAAAKLVENADVFSATNQLNIDAHTALQTLTSVFSDSQYTGSVAAKLFDPTVSASNAASIIATLDWVLFVRRRHKQCQVVQQPAVATKTYSVFVIDAADSAHLKLAESAVVHDDPATFKQVTVRQAGTVSFGAGTSTLASSAQSVLSAWNGAQPGPTIAFAAVATDETDEAATLLRERALAYQAAVASAATPVANEQVLNRGLLHSLPGGGVDGQLVFVTLTASVRYHVYAANNNDSEGALASLVDGAQPFSSYFGIFTKARALSDLGTITFADQAATVVQSGLGTLTTVGLSTAVTRVVVVSKSGTAAEPPSQVNQILTGIGVEGALPNVDSVGASAAGWPADSPIVVIVAPVLME